MLRSSIYFFNLQKKVNGLKVILERDDIKYLRNLQANRLSIEMRLQHNIMSIILFLKIRRFDWVTKKDIAFVYYLMKGKPINLPFFMLSKIKEAIKKSRACLPYRMVFALIFIELGVDNSGEDAKKFYTLTEIMRDMSTTRATRK